MKKSKLIKLPILTQDEMSKLRGGNVAPCACDCSCVSTSNNGCIDGSGTAGAG